MEIFENCARKTKKLDDTKRISVTISTVQQIDNHAEYVIYCQRDDNESWKILRRYNEFYLLNRCFSSFGICLPLPKKKLFGNMRPEFIAERRKNLQEFLNIVYHMNPILASSLPAKRFVDPDNYAQSFHDNAVQNSSLCLRNEGIYVLSDDHYSNIGWRLRKQYFKVVPKITEINKPSSIRNFVKQSHRSQSQQSKAYVPTHSTTEETKDYAAIAAASVNCDLVMGWIEYGPDKYIEDRDVQGTLKSLIGLQHPYIEPIKYATCNENGVLVIRKFYKHGTLKDQICVASCPKKPYLAKYGNPKERKALPLEDIAKYGIQILEALKFLQSKGLPYGGHLHSGNIVIYEGSVRLLDIENFICGVPSFYRPFFVQHSKLYSLETIDVYCFGHVLYEMFMGHPLQESQARQISSNCPDSFKQLLESILSKEACKVGLPFLDGLLQHQFFKEYFYNRSVSSPTGSGNTYFKLSINVKSDIQAAKLKYEQRLRDEQKSIKNQKRLVKVQEFMSLEEERKSKHRTKTEQRQARLKHQHSLHKNHSFSLNERTHSSLDNSQSISSVTTETPEHNICELVEPRGAQSSFSEAESVKEGEIKKDEQKSESQPERSALLESISSFNRKSLRRVNNTEH